MSNIGLIIVEGFSAALALILVRFMIKPYRMMCDVRYLGLPLGFAFLAVSYVFMGASLHFSDPVIVEKLQWLQLFTGAYAFIFLALTYYFSDKTHKRRTHLLVQALVSLSFLVLFIALAVVFMPPPSALQNYKRVDEYFRIFNMTCALYITFYTLRRHVRRPAPETILAPLGYALLAFSQYSFLIWSLDASYSAFIGAHIIRVASLLTFLFISFKAYFPRNWQRKN